ncbi:hypothetical protein LINPERPRIM_LOCUS27874, partial [Linum perenne]
VRQESILATRGGLVRDEAGHCLLAFSLKLKKFFDLSLARAEIKAAITGLESAWEAGYRKFILQTDSKVVGVFLMEDGKVWH